MACVSLLLNSFLGILLYPQTIFAEEVIESTELELIEEVVSTPEANPTSLPASDTDEIEKELPETLEVELEESPVVEESASLVVSLWIENEDGSVTTSSTVGEGVEYYYKDTQTKVVFTKLTEPGYLTIREFDPEDAEELGILGKAYEITSDMQNGTFLYDLTLPLSEEVGDDFEIKYAENGDSLDNAQVVEELKEENENTVTIRGLDHFTVFIVTDDEADYDGGTWIDYATQGYYSDGVHYPLTVPVGQTATWTFSGITPGIYSVYISWSTDINRTTAAPYTLNYSGSSTSFEINQELLADQSTVGGVGEWSGWYSLGEYSLDTSSTLVLASVENSSELDYVIADEILISQAPVIVSPLNNSFLKTSELLKIDWTDSVGNGPFTYRYQAFSDEGYLVNRYGPTAWFSGSEIPTPNTPEGVYYVQIQAKDANGNETDWSNGAGDPYKITVDNTAPLITWDMPIDGSTHNGAIHLKALCNENCDYVNFWWREESETYSSSLKRYHYVYVDGTEFEWDLNTLNAERADGTFYQMTDGTYYLYAAGKDIAGNWARTPDIQIIVDNTAPTADLIFPIPGASSTSFEVTFSENVVVSEAENPANYFLNNWPGAGGSGDLSGDVSIVYDSSTKTSTIIFMNSSWYISAEQEWGVQNIHDLAGNLLSPNPTIETSTPMINPDIPGLPVTLPNPTNNISQTWNWMPSIDPGGVFASGIKGYYSRIYDSLLSGFSGDWVYIGNVLGTITNLNEGSWKFYLKSEDRAGNQSGEVESENLVIDTTAPAMPTGLKFQSQNRTQNFACGATVPLQVAIPDWDDITGDPTFSHYEYTSFHPNGSIGLNEQVLTVSELNNSWMPPADGAYGYAVRSVDFAGNKSDWALSAKTLAGSCRIIYDSTAPTKPVFTAPANNLFTNVNFVTLTWSEGDDTGIIQSGIKGYTIRYDFVPMGGGFTIAWTSNLIANGNPKTHSGIYGHGQGTYTIYVSTTDNAGNVSAESNPLTLNYDATAPVVTWTSPAEGVVISGSTVVGTDATDSFSGVKSVTYSYQKVGEGTWSALDIKTSFPYETIWDTTGLPLGDYTLRAIAEDNAGNNSTEIFRSVGVAAVISGEFWSRPGWGEITINWTTDRPTDGRVVYDTVSHPINLTHPNYGYANTSGTVDTSPKTLSHTVILSGLSNGVTYYWRTVSAGSPTAISAERRGDTFSIPGGSTGGGGTVVGLATSTTPFAYDAFEVITATEEENSGDILGEEAEIVTEEPETAFNEAVDTLTRTTKGRIAAIGAFVIGLILFFFTRRRR